MHIRRSLVVFFLVMAIALTAASVALAAPQSADNSSANAIAQASDLAGTFVAPAVLAALQAHATYYVYTTRTGARYHRHYCVSHHTHFKHTVSWAKSHGLRPCKVCRP